MNKVHCLILLVFVVAGCTSKKVMMVRTYEFKTIGIAGTIDDISIEDKRENITNRELKVPTMSFPWNHDEVSPILTPGQRNMIKDEVSKYFVSGKDRYRVTIEIIEGKKIFDAKLFTEQESAKFRVKITLAKITNSARTTSGTGNVWFEVESIDASKNFAHELYLRTLRASINQSFERISTAIIH